MVYQFRLFVAQSGIPGAKYGAFIEFLGAWRLNEESHKLNDELHGQLQYYNAPTRENLQAVFKEGDSGVTVRLTGENLHGFGNRCYVPRDALKTLKATKPLEGVGPHSVFASCRKNLVKVRIVGEHLEIPAYEGSFELVSVDAPSITFRFDQPIISPAAQQIFFSYKPTTSASRVCCR